MRIALSWTMFKDVVIGASLPYRYIEYTQYNAAYYKLLASEGNLVYECHIQKEDPRSSDQADFEDNYKDGASQLASVIEVRGEKFKPQVYNSVTRISLSSSSDTELCNLSFEGKLDYVSVNFNREYVEIAIEVDGNERLRVALSDLANVNKYDAGDIGFYRVLPFGVLILPVVVVNYGKHFIAKFEGADVSSSVIVKAKATTGQNTKMYGIMVNYRKKE